MITTYPKKIIDLSGVNIRELFNKLINNTTTKESKCLNWLGARSERGYALYYSPNQKPILVSRLIMKIGGHDVDHQNVLHRCDNKLCINPDHLFLGTLAENNDDKIQKGRQGVSANSLKTHCKWGHEYNLANTKMRADGTYGRQCKTCRRQLDRRRNKTRIRNRKSRG